jgi:hypothetical protein
MRAATGWMTLFLGAGIALLPISDALAKKRKPAPPAWSDAALPVEAGEGARLTQGPGGVILSWVEASDDGPALRAAGWTGSEWEPAQTVAVVPELFSTWADAPIVIAGAGHRAAAWLIAAGHGAHLQVSRQPTGGAWSPPVRVHTDESATEHGFPTLFPLANGSTQVAWLDGRDYAEGGSGRTGLYRRSLGSDGLLGLEQVIDPRTCDCCPTSGALLANETPLLAWRDRIGGEVRDISTAQLGRGADPVLVHDDGWEFGGCPVNGPAVAPLGSVVSVAWITEAGGPRIRLALAGADGKSFGPPRGLAEGDDVLGRVASTTLPDGGLLVTWVEGSEEKAEIKAVVATASTLTSVFGLGRVPGARTSGFHHLVTRQTDVLLVFTEDGHLVGRSVPLDGLAGK